jgi:hypothetical protein
MISNALPLFLSSEYGLFFVTLTFLIHRIKWGELLTHNQSLLIFFLNNLSIDERRVLKSPTIIVARSVCPVTSDSICF